MTANEKQQIKIAQQNYYTEKREKERDPALLILVVFAGLLQFYKFLIIISRIEDGVRHKFSCLKILIQESVSCICFFDKFPLADFSIFFGNAFDSRTPNRRENEFFSCSRLEDMTQNLLVVADLVLYEWISETWVNRF